MSIRTVATKFVELCRAGKNFDVMHTMYDPNIVSVEGDGKETKVLVRIKNQAWSKKRLQNMNRKRVGQDE